jgi:hypothetical protein
VIDMTLLTAHRILIAAAILFFVFYGIWEFAGVSAAQGRGSLWHGVAGLAAAVALGLYFATLWRRRAAPGGRDQGGGR